MKSDLLRSKRRRLQVLFAALVGAVCLPSTLLANTIGGSVLGLEGNQVELFLTSPESGNQVITRSTNGLFQFTATLPTGHSYEVTTLSHPQAPAQWCTISNRSGVMYGDPVSNVQIDCANRTFPVYANVTGVVGSGLVLTNDSATLAATDYVIVFEDGIWQFPAELTGIASFSVAVSAQPATPTQACIVTANGSGNVADSAQTVDIWCQAPVMHTLSGAVNGLAGQGLKLVNVTNSDETASYSGAFTFSTQLTDGDYYDVVVLEQPTGPAQSCEFASDATGYAFSDVSLPTLNCTTDEFNLSGTLSGLSGDPVTVTLNGAFGSEVITNATNGAVTFATGLTDWTSYSITVEDTFTHDCVIVAGASGWVNGQHINNLQIECVEKPHDYSVWASVSGMLGGQLVLTNDGADSRNIYGNGTFLVSTGLGNGEFYDVTATSLPADPNQSCAASGPVSGIVSNTDVTVSYQCQLNEPYTVGVTSIFLSSVVSETPLKVIEQFSGAIIPITDSETVLFPLTLTTGDSYDIQILQQPDKPKQDCSLGSGNVGTIAATSVRVIVYCPGQEFEVSATVSGLDAANELTVSVANNYGVTLRTTDTTGTWTFGNFNDYLTYEVEIYAQPSTVAQTCSVENGVGQVDGADVFDIAIDCQYDDFNVYANVVSLEGDGLVLSMNDGASLLIEANGAYPFSNALTGLADWNVEIENQPTDPAQTCWFGEVSGTVANASTTVNVYCQTHPQYSLSISTAGLEGDSLTLRDAFGGAVTVIESSGVIEFPDLFTSGTNVSLQIDKQPQTPLQSCTFTDNDQANISGTITSDVSLDIECATLEYQIGGTVAGLSGQGFVLGLSTTAGTSYLAVDSNGAGGFGYYADQTTYAVAVVTQPTWPAQTCTVDNATGQIQAAAVSDVAVTCTDELYTLYANVITISTGAELVLRNGSEDLVISTAGSWAFPTQLTGRASFSVTVSTQPAAQFCVFPDGAAGQMADASTTVNVVCGVDALSLGGSVSDLIEAQQPLRLVENVSGLIVPVTASGSYSFPLNLTTGNSYDVRVFDNPQNPNQLCTVSNGLGSVPNNSVNDANVQCALAEYSIGGFVSGLNGQGLGIQLAVTGLVTGSGATLEPADNGVYSFGDYDDHSQFIASVVTQPTLPAQTCAVDHPSGQISGQNVSNVTVNCSDDLFQVYANVSGLSGAGLVLQNNGGDDHLIFADGSWPFPTALTGLANVNVSVANQPVGPAQTCSVQTAPGQMSDAATSIAITCVDDGLYTVSVAVTGVEGNGLRLLEGYSGSSTSVYESTTVTFPISLTDGDDFVVSVLEHPAGPSQTCEFTGGATDYVSGIIAGDQILDLVCQTDTFLVGGSVSGMHDGNNVEVALATTAGVTTVTVQDNGLFSVASYVDESTYVAWIQTQPSLPSQTCAIENSNGLVYGAPVSNIIVNCELDTYPVYVTVSGLQGLGLSLVKDGNDTMAVPTSGTWTFDDQVTGTATYMVEVTNHPVSPAQTCIVNSAMPVAVADSPTYVSVLCTDDDLYHVSVTVGGLAGTGLDLVETFSAQLTNAYDNGTHTFPNPFTTGDVITIQVDAQPVNPAQTCVFDNGLPTRTATFGLADLAYDLTCTHDLFSIGGSVAGLNAPSFSVTMATDTAANIMVLNGNGPFSLGDYVDQTTYFVEIAVHPTGQFCEIESRSGVVYAADVSSIEITCADLDSDGDGLSNIAEINVYNTDPYNVDTDGDTLSDYAEVITYTTNPLTVDTDNDLAWDNAELSGYGGAVSTDPLDKDTDDDGLWDGTETSWNDNGSGACGATPNVYTAGCDLNPTDPDTDDGGIYDGPEIGQFGLGQSPGVVVTDPLDTSDDEADADADGISDYDETHTAFTQGLPYGAGLTTNPLLPDTDGDGLTDSQEILGLYSDPNSYDTDSDGLGDFQEFTIYASDLTNPDTDGDTLIDGDEVFEYGTDPLTVDTDADGAQDNHELAGYGAGVTTNPLVKDSDGDGLLDGEETAYGDGDASDYDAPNTTAGTGDLNPTDPDTDDGGIWDGAELNPNQVTASTEPRLTSDDLADADNDGISDYDEVHGVQALIHLGSAIITAGDDPDTDHDGLSDAEEIFHHNSNPTVVDTDGDGLTDFEEAEVYDTILTDTDTDNDTLSDYAEVLTHHTNPLDQDTDNDTISDSEELVAGLDGWVTNPLKADSDGDGIPDNIEIGWTNPNDVDTDDDGLTDDEEDNNLNGVQDAGETHPNDWDSDNDLVSDGHEVKVHNTDPLDMDGDTDNDGWSDYTEIVSSATNPRVVDTDGDGIWDPAEAISTQTNPLNADTDFDGLSDGFETAWNQGGQNGDMNTYTAGIDLNPNSPDSDLGGIIDQIEVQVDFTNPLDISDDLIDTDGDGITDYIESNDLGTNPENRDQDNDGLDDGHERTLGTNLFSDDSDLDGLTDYQEVKIFGTSPINLDTDGDTLTDPQEVNEYGTNPLLKDTDGDQVSDVDELYDYGTDPLNKDSDFDDLLDGEELYVRGTNPLHIDSDADGLTDTFEIFDLGTDPANQDTDGDGISDGEEYLVLGTDPLSVDSDGDGDSDFVELNELNTDPTVSDDSSSVGGAGGQTQGCALSADQPAHAALQWLLLLGLPALYLRRQRKHANLTMKTMTDHHRGIRR